MEMFVSAKSQFIHLTTSYSARIAAPRHTSDFERIVHDIKSKNLKSGREEKPKEYNFHHDILANMKRKERSQSHDILITSLQPIHTSDESIWVETRKRPKVMSRSKHPKGKLDILSSVDSCDKLQIHEVEREPHMTQRKVTDIDVIHVHQTKMNFDLTHIQVNLDESLVCDNLQNHNANPNKIFGATHFGTQVHVDGETNAHDHVLDDDACIDANFDEKRNGKADWTALRSIPVQYQAADDEIHIDDDIRDINAIIDANPDAIYDILPDVMQYHEVENGEILLQVKDWEYAENSLSSPPNSDQIRYAKYGMHDEEKLLDANENPDAIHDVHTDVSKIPEVDHYKRQNHFEGWDQDAINNANYDVMQNHEAGIHMTEKPYQKAYSEAKPGAISDETHCNQEECHINANFEANPDANSDSMIHNLDPEETLGNQEVCTHDVIEGAVHDKRIVYEEDRSGITDKNHEMIHNQGGNHEKPNARPGELSHGWNYNAIQKENSIERNSSPHLYRQIFRNCQ